MGQQQATEYFSVAQTETQLEEALKVVFGEEPQEQVTGIRKILPSVRPAGPFTGRLHDFDKFMGRRDTATVVGLSLVKLRGLSLRCFPLYRNVIARYETAALKLLDGKKRGVRDELEATDKARAAVAATMKQVDDYLNYYEATQSEGASEAFRNYQETRARLEKRGRPIREDRISKYLDPLEIEFQEESD